MKCIICNNNKAEYNFKIEFIDRFLINNIKYEKIIYSNVCHLCKSDYETKMNSYTVVKSNTIKDSEIKKLFVEFDG